MIRRSSNRRPAEEGRLLQLVYYGYVAGSALARALPERVAYGLAHVAGDLGARAKRGKNSQVERNLSRITGLAGGSPELFEVMREAHRSYARYWLETFRAIKGDARFFLERTTSDGAENIQRMLDQGRGAVILIGHLGNWDSAAGWAGAMGWKVVAVAERLRPQRMFDFFVSHREALGITIYPAERGVTAKLVDAIEAGAVVPLLGDRDLKGTGVPLQFFGEEATFPRGTASLALRTGVPVLFIGLRGIRRDDRRWGWHVEVSEPIEPGDPNAPDAIERLTAAVVAKLEDYVRRWPTEWHVFQPFWTADRRE